MLLPADHIEILGICDAIDENRPFHVPYVLMLQRGPLPSATILSKFIDYNTNWAGPTTRKQI